MEGLEEELFGKVADGGTDSPGPADPGVAADGGPAVRKGWWWGGRRGWGGVVVVGVGIQGLHAGLEGARETGREGRSLPPSGASGRPATGGRPGVDQRAADRGRATGPPPGPSQHGLTFSLPPKHANRHPSPHSATPTLPAPPIRPAPRHAANRHTSLPIPVPALF